MTESKHMHNKLVVQIPTCDVLGACAVHKKGVAIQHQQQVQQIPGAFKVHHIFSHCRCPIELPIGAVIW